MEERRDAWRGGAGGVGKAAEAVGDAREEGTGAGLRMEPEHPLGVLEALGAVLPRGDPLAEDVVDQARVADVLAGAADEEVDVVLALVRRNRIGQD